jgi:hypothetical protein
MQHLASLLAVAALIRATQLTAQAATPRHTEPSTLEAPLTNGEIVKLTKAGLSPDLIVMKIKQAPSEPRRLDQCAHRSPQPEHQRRRDGGNL